MTSEIYVRECLDEDHPGIFALYPASFPDEDLVPLVAQLLSDRDDSFSLVCEEDGEITGHVMFTRCWIEGCEGFAGLLGPLCVSPNFQRKGAGSLLVKTGLERMAVEGATAMFVLGDPAYYGRFGFTTEQHVSPPYELPDEWNGAWQSVIFGEKQISGELRVTAPWQNPSLWSD